MLHFDCLIARCLEHSASIWPLQRIVTSSKNARTGLCEAINPFLYRLRVVSEVENVPQFIPSQPTTMLTSSLSVSL